MKVVIGEAWHGRGSAYGTLRQPPSTGRKGLEGAGEAEREHRQLTGWVTLGGI